MSQDNMSDSWFVYILRCADGSFYTGITTDVERRIREHNHGGNQAAAYTRSRRPVTLVYQENCSGRPGAARREAAIRKLGRKEKENLVR
jgi:putative endonuclease